MYIDIIKRYTEEELKEEEQKLLSLLMSLDQSHKDREETISLVNCQLDQVRNLKAFRYGPETF